MSRIAGIISLVADTADTVSLRDMLTASRPQANWLMHEQIVGRAALGWVGLHSPTVAAVEGLIVMLDGHIYNRREFSPADPDVGILARLYHKCGFSEALAKLNGDFAVALYDPEIQTLWLGRDRFGVKPLYYVSNTERFAFASRPRALMVIPGVSKEVNRQFVALFAASHYRYFDNSPEQSPYADIAQLPAAHIMQINGGRPTNAVYWSLQDLPDFTEPEDELAERYRGLLMDAVSLRLKPAQQPAFTLSGGMDSSSVLGCAVRLTHEKQHAFSTVYEDATYDESNEIGSMLPVAVERWHPVRIGSPDFLTIVSEMIDIHDEPVATATWLSHYLMCKDACATGFGSLFGGLGGDELNAGEYEYFFFFFADLLATGCKTALGAEIEKWMAHHDHPVFRKSSEIAEQEMARLVDLHHAGRCLPDRQRLGRYIDALNPDYFNLRDFEPVMDHPFTSYLKNRTFQDIFRETAPCCLRAEDRHTTALGLMHFLPFFDHRLVEFMFRIPGRLKIRDGITKVLLRQAMRGILPEETRTRVKKTGWNAPAHVWFACGGADEVVDLIHSQCFRQRGIYNLKEVDRLIEEHREIVSSGKALQNHMMFIWQLVNLELWLQRHQSA